MEMDENRTHSLMACYFAGGSRSDNPYVNFYWDFCSPGKPGHVQIRYPELSQILELLRSEDGVAILAHPGPNIGCDGEMLGRILDAGEAYSSYHVPAPSASLWRRSEDARCC